MNILGLYHNHYQSHCHYPLLSTSYMPAKGLSALNTLLHLVLTITFAIGFIIAI